MLQIGVQLIHRISSHGTHKNVAMGTQHKAGELPLFENVGIVTRPSTHPTPHSVLRRSQLFLETLNIVTVLRNTYE